MLSLLPASMDPPPPFLPPLSLSLPAAVVAPSPSRSHSQSAEVGGSGSTRKRKSRSTAADGSADALPSRASNIAADAGWTGHEPPLPSASVLQPVALRPSTASLASSAPSPRPRSSSSLHSSPQRYYRSAYDPLEAPTSACAGSQLAPLSQLQSQSRPASQPLPTALAPLSSSVPAFAAADTASHLHAHAPATTLSPADHVSFASQPSNLSQPWPVAQLPTALTTNPTTAPRALQTSTSTATTTHPSPHSATPLPPPQPAHSSPLSPPPPPPPAVPPPSITTLMPVMPYTRVEPAVDQHCAVLDGDVLLGRYWVVRLLGRGTFSQVVQCRDLQAEEERRVEEDETRVAASGKRTTDIAIKIVRAVERYRVAAEREARLLQSIEHKRRTLPATSPYAMDGCVSLLGSFMLSGHLCLVFPVLGLSLYDFLRLNRFRPLFPAHIRHIGYQLLQTCAFLHEECGVIHADIKPENVLLVDSSFQTIHIADMAINVPLSTAVRLIDFGTAVQRSSDRPALVVSRSYRAAEVLLGVGWAEGVDVWAVGCVLMELYTGQRLFSVGQGGNEAHLRQMQQLLGAIPAGLLALPRVYPPSSPTSSPLGSPVASGGAAGAAGGAGSGGMGGAGGVVGSRLRDRVVAGDVKFCALIERMLTFDPRQRITARQALQHPYFIDGD